MITKPHTDSTDLTNFSFDDVKSHGGFTTASLQSLTQIPQISRIFSFDGVKSHGGFTTASLQRLTQIPQISRNFSFDDVKSHGDTSIALEKKHLFYPLKIH